MCGIAGTLCFHGAAYEQRLLRRMLGAIRHRGPDEFGIYLYRNGDCCLGLGSARLSIIDLGGGQQPISNEDGTKWIVFNGEIFNYVELRRELEGRGHCLGTDSDTEVILHLFEDYGPDCVQYLNGQFAFAIWDEQQEELFLARDRLGIRPLCYTQQNGHLVFASEIKALLTHPAVSVGLDPIALDQIFAFWSPLSPRTAFEGVNSLPPAHWMSVGRDGHIHVQRYWKLAFPTSGCVPCDDVEEAAQALRELLVDATTLRLRADVPVGAYLSGGLDSSTITGLIHRYTDNRMETFSVAFADKDYDESDFQCQMANHLGTRHHTIRCTHSDIGRVFPEMIWHTETPVMRASPAPLFLLSALVRDHGLKVVLTGEGADEFLAGYNLFKEAKIRRFWARQPDSRGRPALLQRLYPYIGGLSNGSRAYRERFFGQGLTDTSAHIYSHQIRWHNTSRAKRLFSKDLNEEIIKRDGESQIVNYLTIPPDYGSWSPMARAQYLEATIFLPEYLLSSQGDRVAMAHSVEGRFPFLDHRVVEFCNGLKPRLKLHGLNEKHILRRAAKDLLPRALWRRPKRPYRAPIHASFFVDRKPREWVADLLSEESLKDARCFDTRAVAMLIKKVQNLGKLGETDDMALAGLLSTQLVHRLFVRDPIRPSTLDDKDNIKVVLRHGSSDRLLPA